MIRDVKRSSADCLKQPRLLIALLGVCLASLSCSFLAAEPTPTAFPTITEEADEAAEADPITRTETATPLAPTVTAAVTTPATKTLDPSMEPAATTAPTMTPWVEPIPVASHTPGPILPSPTAPAASPAPDVPRIDYFRASSQEADPGDRITLEWMTTGAITVTLWRLAPTGQFSAFWDVESAASFEYDIGEHERNQTRFALYAGNAAGELASASLSVSLRCPDSWFFSNPPDICPATAAIFSEGAEQYFENGLMLWVGGEDRIYILFSDGNSPNWTAFSDEWDPGEPDRDPNLSPPPGLFQPVRGFGLAWREQPGVRERLGWATAEEIPYPTAVQRPSYAKYNETYIRAADGAIWKLLPERSGWEKIPG
jgi:hypothetical protein